VHTTSSPLWTRSHQPAAHRRRGDRRRPGPTGSGRRAPAWPSTGTWRPVVDPRWPAQRRGGAAASGCSGSPGNALDNALPRRSSTPDREWGAAPFLPRRQQLDWLLTHRPARQSVANPVSSWGLHRRPRTCLLSAGILGGLHVQRGWRETGTGDGPLGRTRWALGPDLTWEADQRHRFFIKYFHDDAENSGPSPWVRACTPLMHSATTRSQAELPPPAT